MANNNCVFVAELFKTNSLTRGTSMQTNQSGNCITKCMSLHSVNQPRKGINFKDFIVLKTHSVCYLKYKDISTLLVFFNLI